MPICRISTDQGPQYVAAEIRDGEPWLTHIVSSAEEDRVQPFHEAFKPVPMRDAALLPPVVPSKIVCVGRNYRDHAAELGNEVPKEPLLFFKPPSALLAPAAAIHRPAVSQRVDFEGELGVVIGRRCVSLADSDDAWHYVRGFTCVNDVTARDLQKTDGQWTRAKGFDTFCPVGPWLVTPAELGFSATGKLELDLTTTVNGEVKQRGNTRDLIFDIPFLLRYISNIMTLVPGDLIATGTPAGVGPLAAGDSVEVAISGVGTLRNTVQ